MRHARIYLVLILALVLSTTAACGAQTAGGQLPESTLNIIDTAANFIPEVNLPTLTVNYDQEGVPSLFGIRVTDITRFTGVDLSFLQLNPLYIDWFTRSNLQHVEIEHTKDGMFLYANGQPLPSVAWNADSLNSAVDLADMLGVQNTSVIKRLVPVLQRLGLNVALRFPVASGNEAISLHQRGMTPAAAAAVEQSSAVIHLAVEYREDGVPTIMGLTTRDLAALTGANLSFLELAGNQVAYFKAVNLQNVEVETLPDGLHIYVNGMELPRLAYSPEQIDTLVSLYGQMYPGYQPAPQLLEETLMLVQRADMDLIVQFPVAAAAKRLPLHDQGAGN